MSYHQGKQQGYGDFRRDSRATQMPPRQSSRNFLEVGQHAGPPSSYNAPSHRMPTMHTSMPQPPQMPMEVNRYPINPMAHFARTNISELVQVPTELAEFAAQPQFQQILLRVKEQTMINFISLNRVSENCVESVAIDAPNRESAQLARSLIETHFKMQAKIRQAESRLQKVQSDLFSAQGDIASGMMIEFSIPPELIGLVIGKKGSRIKQIEAETGVTSINVNGDSGKITVVGQDAASAQRAREMLEIREDIIPLREDYAEWLSRRQNMDFLGDMRQAANLMITRVNQDKNTLEIAGTVSAVRSARLMLDTQLEYVDKQIEIETNERDARDKLYAFRKQYGYGRREPKPYQDQRSTSYGNSNSNGNSNNSNSNANSGTSQKSKGGSSRSDTHDSLVGVTKKTEEKIKREEKGKEPPSRVVTYTAAEAAVRTGLSSEKVSDTNKKVITSSKRTSDNVDSLANIEKGKKETKKMNNDKKSEAKGNSVTNDSVPTDNGMKNEEPMLKQLNSAYKKFSENGNGTSKTVKKGDSSEQSEKSVKDVKNNGKQSDINKASTASNAKKEKDSSTSVDTKDNTKAKNDDKGASTDASKTDDKASLTTLTDSVSNLALDNSEKNNERKSNRRNRNKKDVIMDTTTGNSNIPKTERKASPTTVDGKLSEGSVRIIDVESNTIHERVDVPVKAPAVSNEDPLPKRNKKGKNVGEAAKALVGKTLRDAVKAVEEGNN